MGLDQTIEGISSKLNADVLAAWGREAASLPWPPPRSMVVTRPPFEVAAPLSFTAAPLSLRAPSRDQPPPRKRSADAAAKRRRLENITNGKEKPALIEMLGSAMEKCTQARSQLFEAKDLYNEKEERAVVSVGKLLDALNAGREREKALEARCRLAGQMLSESVHSAWSQGVAPVICSREYTASEAGNVDQSIWTKFGFKRNA